MIDQLSFQLGINLEALIVQLFLLLVLAGLPVIGMTDLLRRQAIAQSQRMLWVALILLVPVLGTLAYFAFGPVPSAAQD